MSEAPELLPVAYAEPLAPLPSKGFQVSAFPFEETLERLRTALREEDLWLIHEIDPQMIVKRGGYLIGPTRQLLFFHPRFMVQLLHGNPHALVEVPMKVAITEWPDGRVSVRHPEIESALAAYPGLASLGSELDGIYQRLMARISPC
jgi:uncharacterized protein (DUF302 family)